MNIWHNNLLLNFTKEEFLSFRKVINDLVFGDNSLPFPDDIDRIILRTPNRDISFTFAEFDFEQFKQAMDEAIYFSEIYSMMQ
ncbi:hypothetical protein DDR33_22655 [Pararcticibacter amylolyticus]|uniref:Uncharacterized protein n=2 Tax=Pararcticibacter amylolyticus TaxID=2173175 RepID=A0A2U2PB77_9SPHI|nr:hypothetical protein DDR33_22655 [Pararcticibacter amylolyticus]